MDTTALFRRSIAGVGDYYRALEIVQAGSRGDIWLIGGMVYRGIVSELYKRDPPKVDLDFVVESIHQVQLPTDWTVSINHFGNPKLTDGTLTIDLIPLKNIFSIVGRHLTPTIDNFLSGTPLDIQSIAYDVKSDRVIGDTGTAAILNRQVGVHNLEQARLYEKRYEVRINDYIQQKASSLGFKPIPIRER